MILSTLLDSWMPIDLCSVCCGDRRPLRALIPPLRRVLSHLQHANTQQQQQAGGAASGGSTATGRGASSSSSSPHEILSSLVDSLIGPEEVWVRDRWLHTRHARASASARGLAAIGAACHRCGRSLLLDICLFSIHLPPANRAASGIVDSCMRFAHRLLRAWEAELRMGADDASLLLSTAIERAWLVSAPQFAPLAPLLSAVLRGHMLQAFVPAYADYTLAADRRTQQGASSSSTSRFAADEPVTVTHFRAPPPLPTSLTEPDVAVMPNGLEQWTEYVVDHDANVSLEPGATVIDVD